MTGEFVVAAHSLVFLYHKARSVTSEELAENVCTNPARVRKVMAKLRRAGLVETREGSAHGGYLFAQSAQEVSLLTVLEAVGDEVLKTPWHSGDPEQACLIASGMAGVMDAILARMEGDCRAVLRSVTIAQINDWLFQGGGKTA